MPIEPFSLPPQALILRGPTPYEPELYRNRYMAGQVTVYSNTLFRAQRDPGYVTLMRINPHTGQLSDPVTITHDQFSLWYEPSGIALASVPGYGPSTTTDSAELATTG